MKLTIKSGESIKNAIKYLQDFLEEFEEPYPILKGDMNVYVTLVGFGRKNCPENDKEYILSDAKPFDVEESKYKDARKQLINEWARYGRSLIQIREEAIHKVELDRNYLSTAEEKGKKPEVVELRKKQYAQHLKEYDIVNIRVLLFSKLNEMLERKEGVCWHFLKHVSKHSPYTYSLTTSLVFTNKNGDSWHFSCYSNDKGMGKGSLYKGLPEEMEERNEN